MIKEINITLLLYLSIPLQSLSPCCIRYSLLSPPGSLHPDCLYLFSYGSADSRHTVQAVFHRSLSNKEIFITLNKVIFN